MGYLFWWNNTEFYTTSETQISYTNSTLVVAPENGGVYISGITSSTAGLATDCTYAPKQAKGGYIAKFDTAGQLLMSSYYDAPISDISIDDKGNIYFASWSSLDSLATAGSYLSSKPQGQNAGLFGMFKEKYNCPQNILNLSLSQNTLVTDTGYISYKWYKNGVLISSGINNELTINDSSTYYVVAEGQCNCSDTSNSITSQGTSIENFTNKIQLSISPNPANDYIQIQSSHSFPIHYTIWDLLGKKYNTGILLLQNANPEIIDVKSLAKGFYVIHFRTQNAMYSYKFIKN